MTTFKQKAEEILKNLGGCTYSYNDECTYQDAHKPGFWLDTVKELATLHEQELQKVEKAYGGCTDCYGKGYSTYRHAISAVPDFIGDRGSTTPFKVHMNFCKCGRGKQLKELCGQEECGY